MIKDTFRLAALEADLTLDEGYRLRAYFDTATPPNITGGVGRNLSTKGFSSGEVAMMLHNDIDGVCADLDRAWPWWRILPPGAQRVMANLCFNMGAGRLGGFTHFLAAMRQQDWDEAIQQLENSEWYTQVGERGPRMTSRLSALSGLS